MNFSIFQKTLKRKVSIAGEGLFSGKESTLTLLPAKENSGVFFQTNKGKIPALAENVKTTIRCTVLGQEDDSVSTVEHLLSVLYAYGISNVEIAIEGEEVPILDGSGQKFAELIEKAGIEEQEEAREILKIEKPVVLSKDDVQLIALPYGQFKISCLFHHPKLDPPSQFLSLLPYENFDAIASARTFSVYEEIKPFLNQGLIKGGGLESAVLIKENKVLNPEGLRFKDEFVRHKILDLIGDLSLSGKAIIGHVIALRSGHASNVAFVKKILQNEREQNASFAFNHGRN